MCVHAHIPLCITALTHILKGIDTKDYEVSQARKGILPRVVRSQISQDPATVALSPQESPLGFMLRGGRGPG